MEKRTIWLAAARVAVVALALWVCAARPAYAESAARDEGAPPEAFREAPPMRWETIAPGLMLGTARLPESAAASSDALFVALRIDPALYEFALGMASEEGVPHSLREWSERSGLCAGINASMYLPDNITSTGYLRSGSHVNNSRAGARLGAFFVANPKSGARPAADIVEHDSPGWRERLEQYGLVAQNYRLVDGSGRILWPEGGQRHSIAAVAKDGQGRILFLLSQEPLAAARFAWYVRNLPLGATVTMYVEGGAQAGLFVLERDTGKEPSPRPGAVSYAVAGGMLHVWKGRQSLLGTRGNAEAPLPNVLGIRPVKGGGN